ncbi:MAG: UDP-glucose 4-epimerase GalE [Bacilli bacterium]|nr:UDP-glucose 4-epimerase GalE [Bacilli bacterium]
MKFLVTGGAGYIGSHTIVELLNAGYEVAVIDDFSNSNAETLENIKKITGKDFSFYEGDVCDKQLLNEIFKKEKIDAVIHFAGYKAVGESVEKPLMYYRNNIVSTLSLLEVMEENNVYKFVFSSSATVYGKPHTLPIKEDFPLSATNPYGQTKLMIEQILKDLRTSSDKWDIVILRYFNPIGAHESGLIGEEPNGIPNNIMPYIMRVATGEYDKVHVFGDDYDTIDGTGVRDYIHVVDLAKGHVAALEYLKDKNGLDIFNLGTGNGYSVLQLIDNVSEVNEVDVPYIVDDRRPGDIASCYADPSFANEKLGWKAEKDIKDMCKDAYRFANKQKSKKIIK